MKSAREGLLTQTDAQNQYLELRSDIISIREDMAEMRGQMAELRAEMQSMKWWLFGALSGMMLAATAAIIATFAIWGS